MMSDSIIIDVITLECAVLMLRRYLFIDMCGVMR